jgi:CheY-like chemotaxis protein
MHGCHWHKSGCNLLAKKVKKRDAPTSRQRGMIMEQRMRIGNLLVEAGIISVKTLERALAMQKGSGKRLGAFLKEMGIVTEEEVIGALARQCNLKVIRDFADKPFPKELFELVPKQLALEKFIFPLKRYDGILAVAILDPFDTTTINTLMGMTGMRIYPVLATRDEICSAITKHYGKWTWNKKSGQKVLLVEPSTIITKMYESALAREGYEVLLAADGIAGLKLAFVHHPDLILCDRMVPRMECHSFLHALQAHPETATIPVVLMSSVLTAEEETKALKAGFNDVIGKPATPMHLVGRVKGIFSSKREDPPSAGEIFPDECADIRQSPC